MKNLKTFSTSFSDCAKGRVLGTLLPDLTDLIGGEGDDQWCLGKGPAQRLLYAHKAVQARLYGSAKEGQHQGGAAVQRGGALFVHDVFRAEKTGRYANPGRPRHGQARGLPAWQVSAALNAPDSFFD